MIAEYNRKSFYWGVPGIILQIGGHLYNNMTGQATAEGDLAVLVGTILLMGGLSLYAKAKGRSWLWCFMAFLSIIGLLVLALLKDKTIVSEAESLSDAE